MFNLLYYAEACNYFVDPSPHDYAGTTSSLHQKRRLTACPSGRAGQGKCRAAELIDVISLFIIDLFINFRSNSIFYGMLIFDFKNKILIFDKVVTENCEVYPLATIVANVNRKKGKFISLKTKPK